MTRAITRAVTLPLHQQLVKGSLAFPSAALAALVSHASEIRADSCGSLFLFPQSICADFMNHEGAHKPMNSRFQKP
jgi:hypothetical protein